MPRVSVIMAVHNGRPYLPQAIQSILDQSYSDFEFLIVDDGSTDGSADVVQMYAAGDNRIRLIRQPENTGLPKALNVAIEGAVGGYVARQDADDVSLPHRLEAQVSLLDSRPDLSAVGCWFESLDPSGRTFGRSCPSDSESPWSEQLRSGSNPLAHGSMMLRREAVVSAGGYDERFWFGQDYELWLRLFCQRALGITIVPRVLYKRRKLPSWNRFKSHCQKRYAELALAQLQAGGPIAFDDVRQWVADRYPYATEPDPAALPGYWLLLSKTALREGYTRLCREYGRKAISWSILTSLKAACLILASYLPIRGTGLQSHQGAPRNAEPQAG